MQTLIVPTKGDRPYLPQIIDNAGCPVIVICTASVVLDLEATVVYDLGPVNIQRWWNLGLACATTDHVMVVNDDIELPSGIVQEMSTRLDETGATICYAGGDHMTGWAFMLNKAHDIRADERFCWYWGDNDLHEQAKRLHGITYVETTVTHLMPGRTAAQFDTDADEIAFRAKWR